MRYIDSQILQLLIDQWDVQHFTGRELLWLPRRSTHAELPITLAANIKGALELTQLIRNRWREVVDDPRININSGYRPLDYNRLVGSDDDSMHVKFMAIDSSPYNGDYKLYHKIVKEVVEGERRRGEIIGLGFYDTFCHVDKGHYTYNRNWDERTR
ncbi:MAG: D-Ala-D-Ala carboxypeptidase family metallohydrolase [Phycisphaerales bacterium JB052]